MNIGDFKHIIMSINIELNQAKMYDTLPEMCKDTRNFSKLITNIWNGLVKI